MRVLLDNCVNHKFARLITGHQVQHARRKNWEALENGILLAAAEADGFEALVTVDKNLGYQQNTSSRKIRIIILDTKRITYDHIAPFAFKVGEALKTAKPGAYIVLSADN